MVRYSLLASIMLLGYLAPLRAEIGTDQDGIMFYEDDHFQDKKCPIAPRQDIPKFDDINFGDEADSVKWRIPRGICAILYESDGYRKPRLILFGEGEHHKLESQTRRDQVWG